MNMKKIVRKMSAIAAGATMVGATVVGAMAYDLSDYPSPFIVDGHFVGAIVVGEQALPADIIGASDIAAAIQAESVTPVTTSGSSTTTEVEGGYLFSESDDLVFGAGIDSVNSLIDDNEMPDFLGHFMVENDDGDEFEYDQEITITTGTLLDAEIKSAYDLDDEFTDPVLYYDLAVGGTSFYELNVEFDDAWDAEDFINSEDIELFGQMYTFSPDNDDADDVLTLFGTDAEVYVEKGDSVTVRYEGEDYKVEILGGNSDDSTAIVRVGSETKTLEEGDSRTIGGLPVFVKDVFISNVGEENVAVQLFIGSNKLELDMDGTVTLNGQELDEVVLTVGNSTAGWTGIESLTFTVTPADTEEEVEYIMNGESYVDPLFGSFQFVLAEVADFTDDKEELKVVSTDDMVTLTFTPYGGDEFTLDVAELDASDNAIVAEDLVLGTILSNLGEDAIFMYNDGTAPADDDVVTHVLQITSIDTGDDVANADFEIVIEDLTFDRTYTITKCETISSDIALYPTELNATADTVSFSAANTGDCATGVIATSADTVYTEAGAEVAISVSTGGSGVALFEVDEDYADDAETSTATTFNVTASLNVDDEYDVAFVTALDNLDDNDDFDFYLSEFGTYVSADTEDDREVIMYVPAEEVTYDMFLAPVGAEIVSVTGSEGTSYTINKLPVGSTGVLDKDAMNLIGEKPLIVVGGPFVNTVAAELMGNPTAEQINSMFTSGLGKIKLYTAQNALLVAGYTAQDTLGAAYVLADHDSYANFDGTEVEVVVPSLSSITVRAPTNN